MRWQTRRRALDVRADLYDNQAVKAGDLLKRIRKLAKKNRVAFSYVASHGKGSHGTIYYGARKATIRDVKKELPTGTLMGTLKQLGIRKEDI